MLDQMGTVVGKEGYFVFVEPDPISGCSSCGSQAGCATTTLGKLSPRRSRKVRIPDPLDLQVGERVMLSVSPAGLLRAAFIGYLFPLLIMVAAAMRVDSYGYGEGAVFLASILGLAAALMVINRVTYHLLGGRGRLMVPRRLPARSFGTQGSHQYAPPGAHPQTD